MAAGLVVGNADKIEEFYNELIATAQKVITTGGVDWKKFVLISKGPNGIRYTHSIAGFVRKLSIVLREASEGKTPDAPVQLRKKDPFGWLAADLNACLKTMKGYRMDRGNALAALEILEGKASAGELPDKECIKAAGSIIKQMNGRDI